MLSQGGFEQGGGVGRLSLRQAEENTRRISNISISVILFIIYTFRLGGVTPPNLLKENLPGCNVKPPTFNMTLVI